MCIRDRISTFCAAPDQEGTLATLISGNPDDRIALYDIIEASFERSARITAINLAAIITHIGAGKDQTRPVCVMAEGTTFKKSVLFCNKLNVYVRQLLNNQLGLYCTILSEEDVTLTGTAVAALM